MCIQQHMPSGQNLNILTMDFLTDEKLVIVGAAGMIRV